MTDNLIRRAKRITADPNLGLTAAQKRAITDEVTDLLADAWDEGYVAKPGSTPALSALLGIKNPYRN